MAKSKIFKTYTIKELSKVPRGYKKIPLYQPFNIPSKEKVDWDKKYTPKWALNLRNGQLEKVIVL